MRKLAGVVGALSLITVALAQQPAPKPGEPAQTPPPAPAPAPAQPSAVQPNLTPAQPAAPSAEPKKYEIAADAKPVARQELEGGLIVEDFVVGTGNTVAPSGMVVANYHGTLRNGGAPFDSSWDPAFGHVEPAVFSLDRVIQGWSKGLVGMKAGGLRRLTIPAAMAYGPQQKTDQSGKVTIPANSDLVFVVELIDTPGVEDLTVGTGEEVGKAAVCVTAHSVKTADGKEVEKSTREAPYIWIPGENGAMDSALRGMKVGGKRRVTVPAQVNQNAPLPDIKRPANVPVTIEVELIAVRNLPSR